MPGRFETYANYVVLRRLARGAQAWIDAPIYAFSTVTNVLHYGNKWLISGSGHIKLAGGNYPTDVYAKVYTTPQNFSDNVPPGDATPGKVKSNSLYFTFYGSQNSGDTKGYLIPLADDPNNTPEQYLYVWAKVGGNWANYDETPMDLVDAGLTDKGDTIP